MLLLVVHGDVDGMAQASVVYEVDMAVTVPTRRLRGRTRNAMVERYPCLPSMTFYDDACILAIAP